jgi:sRNA-binding regulator protein Hfq
MYCINSAILDEVHQYLFRGFILAGRIGEWSTFVVQLACYHMITVLC